MYNNAHLISEIYEDITGKTANTSISTPESKSASTKTEFDME